jgi:N-acetylmuramoyl-L-alanine amidase
MTKIVIQAGHINSQYSTLGLGSGAPGEQEINKRIADRLTAILRERGFSVIQTDANANTDTNITKVDQNLFLALHCDADYAGDNGSGFADFPEPATDGATVESQRICKVIVDTYFPETQIVYRNLSNANTRYYYMWKYLTGKTPCVLVEMGQAQDPHDKVLLGNTELIAGALGRSICKAFNVAYDLPKPSNSPSGSVSPSPSYQIPTEQPPVISPDKDTLEKIRAIVWGKGWLWTKVNKIKELLPKQ